MATFAEVREKFMMAKYKKQILDHLVEYLDATFMGAEGTTMLPKKTMLLEGENLPIPEGAFESVVNDVLLAEAKDLEDTIQELSTAEVTTKGKK